MTEILLVYLYISGIPLAFILGKSVDQRESHNALLLAIFWPLIIWIIAITLAIITSYYLSKRTMKTRKGIR